MRVTIVANGELEGSNRLQTRWREANLRIAANGGALNARRCLMLPPQIVIGDLDSLDVATRAWCEQANTEFIQHPRAKDKTDLELAFDLACARGASEITLLGATGGRFDQALANILLLVHLAQARVPTTIVARDFDAQIAWEHVIVQGKAGESVSLIPLTERVEGVVTQGLLFPLHHEPLQLGSTRGISNELIAPQAEVWLSAGVLLVVHLEK